MALFLINIGNDVSQVNIAYIQLQINKMKNVKPKHNGPNNNITIWGIPNLFINFKISCINE